MVKDKIKEFKKKKVSKDDLGQKLQVKTYGVLNIWN